VLVKKDLQLEHRKLVRNRVIRGPARFLNRRALLSAVRGLAVYTAQQQPQATVGDSECIDCGP
jgi:hypothetical protein